MQIIIPMSGLGSRFAQAGYHNIKPLISVGNKTIIEHVINMFMPSDTFIFICNEQHLHSTNLRSVLLLAAPNAVIVPIKPHKYGPVYAVAQAYKYINNDMPCIVNYCDFYMNWNYTHFLNTIDETKVTGAIPCYKGFHPHLYTTNNVYAGCKVDSNNMLLEVKEKYSYTNNMERSHHSVGTYYFNTGATLKHYANLLLKSNNIINGEYYASMVYPAMLNDNKNIVVYDAITHFCQWGTPQDMQVYKQWHSLFLLQKNYNKQYINTHLPKTTLLMPMAGNGQRFVAEGYTLSKPLIAIDNMPMYQRAIQDLPSCENQLFITKQEIVLPAKKHVTQIVIKETTNGQASTCLLAKENINNTNPLLITPCDNGLVYDIKKFVTLQHIADVIVFAFTNNPTVVSKPNQYGWIVVDGCSNITAISCKQAISKNPINDYAITGTFWFRQGNYFVTAAQQMINTGTTINGEYYVDECINNCIENGLTVKVFCVDTYICWGTPIDVKTYNYWESFFKTHQFE